MKSSRRLSSAKIRIQAIKVLLPIAGGSSEIGVSHFGGYYGGTLNEFRARTNYRPTARSSVSTITTWNRFRLPLANGDFSALLSSLQANYSFTRFLTFTSLVQADTSNAQALSANFQLRYNYRPDSDLYIIYNVGTQFASLAPANPPQLRETRFAVKWTYSFAP